MKTRIHITICLLVLAHNYHCIAQKAGYKVSNSFPVSGMGGWDYIALNPVNNNLYIAHSTQVNIINCKNGDSVGVIANTTGVHGVAFAPEFGKGFTSNGKLNSLTVFDINNNKVTGEIKTGTNPDAIMYDEFTKKVYVCNGRSKDLTVIDPSNNTVEKTIDLGGKPETAVSDGAGTLYINIEDKNEIAVLNTKTYIIENRWKTGTGEEPSGLAIDVKTNRLFAGCGNKILVVMDMTSGKVVKELPIGDGCDGVAFDPSTKNIFSANGEGTLTIIYEKSADKYVVVENLKTQKSARTLVLDEKTHKIFLPAATLEPTKSSEPHARPTVKEGSFKVLIVSK